MGHVMYQGGGEFKEEFRSKEGVIEALLDGGRRFVAQGSYVLLVAGFEADWTMHSFLVENDDDEEMEVALAFIRERFRETNVVRYALGNEAWRLSIQAEEKAPVDLSTHPNREDCYVLVYRDNAGEVVHRTYAVRKNDAGVSVLDTEDFRVLPTEAGHGRLLQSLI